MRFIPFVPSLCVLGMATVFLALGLGAKRQARQLATDGITYPGIVSKAEVQSGSKGKKRYIVWVNWGEGEGAKTDDSFVVTPSFYESRIGPDGAPIDPAVNVRALPGQPESAVLVGGSSDLGGMEWLGAVLGVVGVLMLFRTLRRRR